jgi:hypothetical protein
MNMQTDVLGWHLAAWTMKETPCKGKLFCYHVEGEPGLENYEVLIALTRTRALFLGASKTFTFWSI